MCSEVFVQYWWYVQNVSLARFARQSCRSTACGELYCPVLYVTRPEIGPHQGSNAPELGFVSRERGGEALKVLLGLLFLKGMTSPFHKYKFQPPHPHKGPVQILLSPWDLPSWNKLISPNIYNIYPIQSSGNLCLIFLLNHFTYMRLLNQVEFSKAWWLLCCISQCSTLTHVTVLYMKQASINT